MEIEGKKLKNEVFVMEILEHKGAIGVFRGGFEIRTQIQWI